MPGRRRRQPRRRDRLQRGEPAAGIFTERVYRCGGGDRRHPELRYRFRDHLVPGRRGGETVPDHHPGRPGRRDRGRLEGEDPHVDADDRRRKEPLRADSGTGKTSLPLPVPGRVRLRQDARRSQRVHEAPAPGRGRGRRDGGGRPPGGEPENDRGHPCRKRLRGRRHRPRAAHRHGPARDREHEKRRRARAPRSRESPDGRRRPRGVRGPGLPETLDLRRRPDRRLAAGRPGRRPAVREDLRPPAWRDRSPMHRLWEVRADLPRAGGHHRRRQSDDRSRAVHPVLLLS